VGSRKSRYSAEVTPGDIAAWVKEMETEYLCAVSIRIDANRPSLPPGSIRIVAEVSFPSNGVLEPRIHRSHRVIAARSSVSTTSSIFSCLMEVSIQVDQDPQTKFWRIEAGAPS
jgi:hypothetical protein